jgi:muramoyltetrapeptide carboxypeptidase
MIEPKFLAPGSILQGYLLSEPLTESRMASVKRGIDILLKQTSARVLLPECPISNHYTWDEPEARASWFNNEVKKSDNVGLISLWGGKSNLDILEYVDWAAIGKSRKLIFGFSDNCVLLNAIFQTSTLVTFYGPNVVGKLHESSAPNWSLVVNCQARQVFSGNIEDGTQTGSYIGALVGGNLSTFTIGLSGTRYLPVTGKRIFFWEGTEDVQLQGQFLSALKNQGFFRDITLMIVGHSPRQSSRWSTTQREMLDTLFSDLQLPWIRVPFFGHETLPNPIIPVGACVTVEIDGKSVSIRLNDRIVSE